MKLTGSYEINAPRETVWGTLTEPASLQGCIPGCQKLEDVGGGNYEATISASLGPVRGNFSAKVSIQGLEPLPVLHLGRISQRCTPGFVNGECVHHGSAEDGGVTTVLGGRRRAGRWAAGAGRSAHDGERGPQHDGPLLRLPSGGGHQGII